MEHRKGFTLAELLAVIAILGVIALIVFPAVGKVIKNSKEKAYAAQKEIILSSAKNWGLDNLNSLSEEEDTYLSIEQLRQGGYLEKKQVINPITDEEMNGCVIVSYSNEYNQYKYRYEEASCGEVNDAPIITLSGNKTMTINQGDAYTEPGATAKYKDQDITSSIEITGTVDTNTPGTYTIRYNVTYDGKKAKEVIRTVKVLATEAEEFVSITLNPNNTTGYVKSVTINIITTGNIKTLTYKVNGGEEKTVVDNKIVLDQDGEYIIEVIATDNKDKITTVTSETYYIDVTPPTITFEEGDTGLSISTSKVVGYDLKTGVIVEDNNTITLDSVTTSGELSAQEGTYTITYTATDIAGNTTTKTRTIIVKKPIEILGEEVDEDQIMTNDPDENPRYVGPNPDNYVRFNNELWRIIGVFDGQAKIIRETPYSMSKPWDKNEANGGHGTKGYNDWGIAVLQTELNGSYLSSIDDISKLYIDTTHTWNIGGWETSSITRSEFYNKERGNTISSVMTKSTWTGAIGLMYPSDYGYATSSVDNVCNITNMGSWDINGNGNAYVECAQKSWLHNSSRSQWTIMPSNGYGNVSYVFAIDSIGHVGVTTAYSVSFNASPTIYLKNNVKIASGTGTSTDPYILTQEVDQTKTPVIELQVPNNTFNTNGWAKANFNVSITSNNSEESEIKEYKYCYGENCTPDTTSTTNTIAITTESASNYVCATATNQLGNTSDKVCGGPYKLDKTAPVLTVPGSVTITPSQVSGYNLLTGASVTDSLSGVDGSITTSGSLSAVEKTYTITYTAKDKAGNSTSKTRNITVKNPGKTFTEIMNSSSEVMTNDPDGNSRYVGPDPNNYVMFNNELWRIIGIFNGQAKIIRNTPYATKIAWNTEISNNDWSTASLQVELNETFLNSINATSKSYIDTKHIWNLGGWSTYNITRSLYYSKERGTTVASGNATSWTGAIGLIYLSDYGYSTNSTNEICDTASMYTWGNTSASSAYTECAEKSWLYGTNAQWTLTPKSNQKSHVMVILHDTGVYSNAVTDVYTYYNSMGRMNAATPVLYLKSTVKIASGTGTSSNPFILTQ